MLPSIDILHFKDRNENDRHIIRLRNRPDYGGTVLARDDLEDVIDAILRDRRARTVLWERIEGSLSR